MEPASLAQVQGALVGALAPAFLLAGVGGILSVVSQRRNRVVDRLLDAHAQQHEAGRLAALRTRARLALMAMQACILACVQVCLLVTIAFLAGLHGWAPAGAIPALTLGAMLALVAGLLCFLAETVMARTDLPA